MTTEERFLANTKKNWDNDCIEWTGSKTKDGYGRFYLNGRYQLAHRVSWQIHYGDIPEGMCVCHSCDNSG
jgi:hypothetical protein